MWRDRWFARGIIGAAVSCLACLTPVAVIALGAIGLGAWAGTWMRFCSPCSSASWG